MTRNAESSKIVSKEKRRSCHEGPQIFEVYGHSDDRCGGVFHHRRRIRRRASGLTFAYWAALFLTLAGGICQLIAGIKGVRHSKRSEKAGKLIAWGVIVAVFSILSMVMNLVNGGEFNGVNLLTGVAVPALYIYGAVLNSKADDAQPAA